MVSLESAARWVAVNDLALYLRLSMGDAAYEDSGEKYLVVDLATSMVDELPGVWPIPFPARAKAITLEIAARAVRNPEGFAYERGDDYGYGLPSDTRHAGVYLTDSERAELLAIKGVAPTSTFYSASLVSPLDLPR